MIEDANTRVIFVEDDETLREATVQGLELEGFQVEAHGNAASALRRLEADFPGVIVSDIRLPGMDGLEFFDEVRRRDADLPLIFTTGHGDVAMAVEAMKDGAADFLTKPYSSGQLFDAIRRAADKRALVIENRKLRSELAGRVPPRVLGSSQQAERLSRMIADVAAADIDLMIAGASGTGKNFVARQIHDLGPRHRRPFITIDAGIVAHEDAELLIFGRDPGSGQSYSGLSRLGLIEKANGGTLFLDEIATMPEAIQARLLSMVESRTVLPIGADRPRNVNIRVISATRHGEGLPTASAVATSLFHRLSGIRITLPTLAERRDDIPEIFRHFVAEYERDLELVAQPISELEWHHLASHDWTGNLRELRAFARNFVLGLSQFARIAPGSENAGQDEQSLRGMVERFERAVLEDALRRNGGRAVAVAASLKIQRKTLYDKLARYGLRPADFRSES
ncbi:sigma-54 dependent transcriptional regulator [Alteraurantiacibacter aestuarii]|uniref:Response regulator n=1 Tax=Alteraurantiacibacter aestuarii TaxID=650004 RepID=A0A844ZHU5_9SPHN|nr:sigma-54 dependent transcriptional regulator [Alteraurantiacibacter aestuarii]MXO88071.1 response regulator [Alteraurantiacibacter aestuarii]